MQKKEKKQLIGCSDTLKITLETGKQLTKRREANFNFIDKRFKDSNKDYKETLQEAIALQAKRLLKAPLIQRLKIKSLKFLHKMQ